MTVGAPERVIIKEHIHTKLQEKIERYAPITGLDNHLALSVMLPVRVRRQYSAVHSLATSLGMSFYEQIAVLAAETNSETAELHWKSNIWVARARRAKIEEIITDLGNKSRAPDPESEMDEILSVPNTDTVEVSAGRTVDVHIKRGGNEYYIEVKTVAPNISGFLDNKRRLLTWVARANKRIRSCLALPYNPYHPEPYGRMGSKVMQVGGDLLVGESFWDLVGGSGFYDDLVGLFREEGEWYWRELEKKLDGSTG